MEIIYKPVTNNRCYSESRSFVPKGLVLHSIGTPQPSAETMQRAYNQYKPNGNSVCVHAFLDDSVCYQILPWHQIAWHVGGDANYTHIGVEMCEPKQIKYVSGSSFTCWDYDSAEEYCTKTYYNSVELFAKLCKEFDLDPLKYGVIISHSEAHSMGLGSNHGDPEHLWKGLGLSFTMDGFRNDVKNKMEENDMTKEEVKAILKGSGSVVDAWAEEELERAVDNGITDGSRPLGYSTRQETALMVNRSFENMMKKIENLEDEISTKIVDKIIKSLK